MKRTLQGGFCGLEMLEVRMLLSAAAGDADDAHESESPAAEMEQHETSSGAEGRDTDHESAESSEESFEAAAQSRDDDVAIAVSETSPRPQNQDAAPLSGGNVAPRSAEATELASANSPVSGRVVDSAGSAVLQQQSSAADSIIVASAQAENVFATAASAALSGPWVVASAAGNFARTFASAPLVQNMHVAAPREAADAIRDVVSKMMLPEVAAGAVAPLSVGVSRAFHFARVGNPISLLNDAIALFTEESARISTPGHDEFRKQAWIATATIVALDVALLTYYVQQIRSRRRRA